MTPTCVCWKCWKCLEGLVLVLMLAEHGLSHGVVFWFLIMISILMGWGVVDLSIVQGAVYVVLGWHHLWYLLVGCVVASVLWRDVMVLWDVVPRWGEGDLVARPGLLHGGVGDRGGGVISLPPIPYMTNLVKN